MIRSPALALLAAFALSGCVATKFDIDEAVTAKGVLKVNVIKIHDKFKKGKYDVTVDVTNLHSESIVLYFGELRCFRNGVQGKLDYPFFGAGERAIDLKLGETKRFNYTCKTERRSPRGKDFKLVYGRIFANPNNDGFTSGRILAKELPVAIRIDDAE